MHFALRLRLASLLFLAAVAADVIFQHEGEAAVPAAVGHLAFEIRHEDIREMFAGKARALLTGFKRLTGEGLTWKAQERELEAIAESIERTVQEMLDLATVPARRVKRSFMAMMAGAAAIFGIGFGIKNSYDLKELKKRVERNEDAIADLLVVARGVARTTARDHEMLDRLLKFEEGARGQFMAMQVTEAFLEYKVALRALEADARMHLAGYYALYQGHLHPALLDLQRLESAYAQFKTDVASVHQLRPVFDSAKDLLRSEVTFWAGNNSLVFAIGVPFVSATDNLLSVYRLDAKPVQVANGSGLELVYDSEHTHLAVDKDRSYHYPMTADEWGRCGRMAGLAFCTGARLRLGMQLTCIGSLYQDRTLSERGRQLCRVEGRRRRAAEVREVSPGRVQVLSSAATWHVDCGSERTNITHTRPGQVLEVSPGCSVSTLGSSYKVLPEPLERVRRLQLSSSDTVQPPMGNFSSWEDISALLASETAVWRRESEIEAIGQRAEHARQLVELHRRHSDGAFASVCAILVLGALVLVALAAEIVIWVQLRRHRTVCQRRLDGAIVRMTNLEDEEDANDSRSEGEAVRKKRRRRRVKQCMDVSDVLSVKSAC